MYNHPAPLAFLAMLAFLAGTDADTGITADTFLRINLNYNMKPP